MIKLITLTILLALSLNAKANVSEQCGQELLVKKLKEPPTCILEAESGNIMTQMFLGEFYLSGMGISEANYVKSFYWYNKASEQHPIAQLRTGQMLIEGKGVLQDKKAGTSLIIKACQSKLEYACDYLKNIK